jgi:leucyl-tRNA synthetase
VLSPYASHIAEELWSRLGGEGLVCTRPWRKHDHTLVVDDAITLGVQVNGKRRDEITVPTAASDDELKAIALASPRCRSSWRSAGKEGHRRQGPPREHRGLSAAHA